MAKSKIIKELVNDEISLTVALNRLYVLASDLDNNDLLDWVSKELAGYKIEDELPEYRIFTSAELVYSGINGNYQITEQPLSLSWLNPETVKKISVNRIPDSISELENKAKSGEQFYVNRSYLAGEVKANTYKNIIENGVLCFNIQQRVAPTRFGEILAAIKQKVLKLLLELDKQFGCLDDLDIGSSKIGKKDKLELFDTLNLILTDKSIAKNKTVIKNSNMGQNNTIDKKTNIEVSSYVEVTNNEKKSGFLSWIKGLFRRK